MLSNSERDEDFGRTMTTSRTLTHNSSAQDVVLGRANQEINLAQQKFKQNLGHFARGVGVESEAH